MAAYNGFSASRWDARPGEDSYHDTPRRKESELGAVPAEFYHTAKIAAQCGYTLRACRTHKDMAANNGSRYSLVKNNSVKPLVVSNDLTVIEAYIHRNRPNHYGN